MYIYKITNKINNKIYIGQVYNKTIYDRFERHIKEASPNSRSYIGRAINKYGAENFVCELIDTASSLNELNQKEIYWIAYYNSTDKNIGYNLTSGGDGGNTYLCKTKEEMKIIKEKISNSNKGIHNGQSKQIKALNVITKEVIHFDTLGDACKYFNHKQKYSFITHCNHIAKYLWRKEWTFAYENEDFHYEHLEVEYDNSARNGKKIKVINLLTNEEQIFNSLSKLELFLKNKNLLDYSIYKLQFDSNNECIFNNFKIILLNNKCVSTIPDECKGVGLEISTNSKQEAI